MVANNFLQSQGYPRSALFDPARPAETLSALADTMLQRTVGIQVNSITYVKPAVSYIQVQHLNPLPSRFPINHWWQNLTQNKLLSKISIEIHSY